MLPKTKTVHLSKPCHEYGGMRDIDPRLLNDVYAVTAYF